MASKKKTRAKSRPAAATKVKPSEVKPAISQQKLRSLMASNRRAKNDIAEIAGGLGSEIKTAVEKHHLHRKAFNVIKQGDRMEPEKLADFLDCLEHYLDISGLNERAAQVQRLALDDGEKGGEEEVEEDETVRRFPAPAGVAAE